MNTEEIRLPRALPLVVAHRGNSAFAPENTLVAAREAFDLGAQMIECDVRRSADGHIVLLHDPTFARTAGHPGAPEDLTLAQIRALDAGSWKDPRYAGERVPLLAELLDLVAERGSVLIDLKQEGLTADIARLVRERELADRVLLGPWTLAEAAEARRRLPDSPITLIGSLPSEFPPAWWRELTAHGVRGFNSHHAGITAEFAIAAAQRALAIFAWTVDEPAEMRRLAALGVTGLVTNDPALCAQTLAR